MAKSVPKTKAGKQKKVTTVMDEWKSGDLRSSSGQKVTNQKQAVAIALSESGQARKRRPAPSRDQQLSNELTRRVGSRDQ